MDKFIAYIKGEPVRVRLYSVALVIMAYCLAKGYVTLDDVEFVGSLAALVLGVETARAKVSPVDE